MTAITGNQSSCNHPQATLKRLLTFPHRREREGSLPPQVRPSHASLPSLTTVCNTAPTTHNLCVLGGARRYKLWKLVGDYLCAALGKPPPMVGSGLGGSAVLGPPRFPASPEPRSVGKCNKLVGYKSDSVDSHFGLRLPPYLEWIGIY